MSLAKIVVLQTNYIVYAGCFPFLSCSSANYLIKDFPVTRAAIMPVMSALSESADQLHVAVNFSDGLDKT